MNADALRHFYDYHFAENRRIWDSYVMSLSQEQFTQPVDYSIGSVRNQIVHVMTVDNNWFSELQGRGIPEPLAPAQADDRTVLRAHWDAIEQMMRDYLAGLSDEMLTEKPLEGEDENLVVWQVLLHVANHGTDHRAQLLRLLNDLGLKTGPQDYIFYIFDHP